MEASDKSCRCWILPNWSRMTSPTAVSAGRYGGISLDTRWKWEFLSKKRNVRDPFQHQTLQHPSHPGYDMNDSAKNAPSEEPIDVLPHDEHNATLVSHVHPPNWKNPSPTGKYNLVAIGGGTAGLISSIATAGLGGKSALVERHLLGGDCLNVGCVPSKALIRAARVAQTVREAENFGVHASLAGGVMFGEVMERMRRLRAGISHHDSAQRFTDAGVDVFLGQATFTGPNTLEVDGQELQFAKAVICTGARAARLPVDGFDDVGYLTNETLFSLTELPKSLIVIGSGPIGSEMAQAFRRFGV